tara:strand:- start:1792 stop:1938 length:147 start_codon:yes stop_codon:yes gene_type:complete
MELIDTFEMSLGLEPYEVLGFNTQDQLDLEIMKLIEIRSDFKNSGITD